MTTSHESFYRILKEYGGILDSSSQPEPFRVLYEMAISTIQTIKDNINKRSDILWPLGDIKLEFVSNSSFNAFAHCDEGEEGIAVFSGLFFLLLDLSSMLWSHSMFLTRTHPTKVNEKELNVFLDRISPLRSQLIWNGFMGVYPTTKERGLRAINTALTAYCFICFHEVGHLVRAHIPYLKEESHNPLFTLFEHNNNNSVFTNHTTLQRLEIDADWYAARAIIDNALTTWNMGKVFPVNYPLQRSGMSQYLTDIFIGFTLAFFCMDILSTNSELQSQTSHPVPAMRLGTCFYAMSELLKYPFKIPQEDAIRALAIAYSEVKDFWKILQLPARTFENDLASIMKSSYEAVNKLNFIEPALGKVMDVRLRKLGTNLQHYEQFKDFYKPK